MLKSNERLIRPSVVCEKLSISRRTLYAWVKSGKIPAFEVAGNLRIPESALDEVIRKIQPWAAK